MYKCVVKDVATMANGKKKKKKLSAREKNTDELFGHCLLRSVHKIGKRKDKCLANKTHSILMRYK